MANAAEPSPALGRGRDHHNAFESSLEGQAVSHSDALAQTRHPPPSPVPPCLLLIRATRHCPGQTPPLGMARPHQRSGHQLLDPVQGANCRTGLRGPPWVPAGPACQVLPQSGEAEG